MLVLSRKEDQKIRIGNNIVINVLSISEGNVKLGIEAHQDIKIYREEIYNSIKDHTIQAVDNVAELSSFSIENLKLNKVK